MKKNFKILMGVLMVMAILQVALIAKPGCRGDKKDMKDMKDKTIVEVVTDNKRFETLEQAVVAAGLVETLQGEGPFTVFAPTNAAFEKLPAGTLEELLKPENKDKLANILTYHVTPGNITEKDVLKLDGQEITMANNQKAKITVKDDEVFINDAKIVRTDIMTKNGVIHVIDAVILPK